MNFSSMQSSSAPSAKASDLVAALLGRAPRVAMALAAGQAAWPLAVKARNHLIDHRTYTVKVLSTDDIYDDLHEWVLSLLPTQDQRALVAWTSNRGEAMSPISSSEGPVRTPRIRLRYDGSREQTITLGGHDIDVSVNTVDSQTERTYRPDEIVFMARSLAAQQRLITEMDQVVSRRKTKRQPAFRMLNAWGDWQKLEDPMPRDLSSVILPKGQLERLVADVEKFLASEAECLRRTIPWHRGHLYEGVPGSGKTSVARALATHFGMDVWYLPLADLKRDADLLAALSRIGPRAMLLLEDVDVFHAMTQRDDDNNGITLSGLLNALDGIATPHGLFTVLTTNDPSVLDPAVIRPGRVDLVEHFTTAGADQIRRLLNHWYNTDVQELPTIPVGMAPSQVVEICKRNETREDAWADIVRTLHRLENTRA